MSLGSLFEDPDDTREEIMKATYDALCAHGYADLTIQRISDEFPKSKSLIYHHYDSKDDLLLAFLEFALDRFEASVPQQEYDTAAERLEAVLDHVLPTHLDEERYEFTSAMIELRAQATHDPAYHAHYTRSTQFFRDQFVAIIEQGIEEGVFRDVDPDRTATLLLTTIEGAMLQRVTSDVEERIESLRAELRAYIETQLLRDAPDSE
jgi:AcrR family transcriptional regulator